MVCPFAPRFFGDFESSSIVIGHPLVAGHLDVCLCLSVLPDFVQSNSVCQSAALLVGELKVQSILEDLVRLLSFLTV